MKHLPDDTIGALTKLLGDVIPVIDGKLLIERLEALAALQVIRHRWCILLLLVARICGVLSPVVAATSLMTAIDQAIEGVQILGQRRCMLGGVA